MHSRTSAPNWWHNAVAYQIYVRSFGDADGDGIGDLEGIIERLDYLRDLGIDAIWLNPCYSSPQYDHGYDVADYYAIDREYGDLATFDRLVHEAESREIRVLMDIVPNHCSHEHAWFRAAVAAGPGSPEREWFWFRDGKGVDGNEPPNNWRAWFGGSAWTRVTEADGTPGQWYLHLFTPQQPDLNWTHEPVRAAFDDILRFWFDRGVSGFRIDAPNVVGKTPGLPDAPQWPDGIRETDIAAQNPHVYHRPEVHELFARWRTVANDYVQAHPGRSIVFIGETFAPDTDIVASYVSDRELHTTFNFFLLLANWETHRWRDAIADISARASATDIRVTWTLNNHDARRIVTRLGHADAHLPSSYTFNNLVYSDEPVNIEMGARRSRAAIALLALLDGPIFLYAGEELGLPEVLDLPDDAREDPIFIRTEGRELGRDGCRVPLPWTTNPVTNFGFSGGSDRHRCAPPWLPQPADFGSYAASVQTNDPTSMLSLYRELIRMRRTLDPAERVHVEENEGNDAHALVLRRADVWSVTNFGDAPLLARVPIGSVRVISSLAADDSVGTTVAPNATVWFRSP